MKLKNNLFKSLNEGFTGKLTKIIAGFAILMCIGAATVNEAYAQRSRSQSYCTKWGFNDTDVNLDGIWNLTFSMADVKYDVVLTVRDRKAVSETSYFDASADKMRRVRQNHQLCGSRTGVIFPGSSPVDMDTRQRGSVFGYNPDTYIITTLNTGKILSYVVDSAGQSGVVTMSFVGDLPND